MWMDIIKWWYSLWGDPTVVGGAIAGLVSSAIMFIFGEIIWKTRIERVKDRTVFQQKQLDCFYAPLYRFYREGYARFEAWKKENPDSNLTRQPFFEPGKDESFAERVLSEHPGYASQLILRVWSDFQAATGKTTKNNYRNKMISILIKEYHELRRDLHLDYDLHELNYGEFKHLFW